MRRDFDASGDDSPKKTQEDVLRDFAKKYEGKSEAELIGDILKTATESRKNGTLTDEEIDRYVALLSPMLSDDQRKKLLYIAKKLKSG